MCCCWSLLNMYLKRLNYIIVNVFIGFCIVIWICWNSWLPKVKNYFRYRIIPYLQACYHKKSNQIKIWFMLIYVILCYKNYSISIIAPWNMIKFSFHVLTLLLPTLLVFKFEGNYHLSFVILWSHSIMQNFLLIASFCIIKWCHLATVYIYISRFRIFLKPFVSRWREVYSFLGIWGP